MSHTKNTSKKGTKDKASSRDAGAVAAQIRAVLESSQVKGTVKRRLNELIGKLHEDFGGSALDETPELMSQAFETGAAGLRYAVRHREAFEEGRAVYDEIARLAEEHEPEDYRLGCRVAELIESDPAPDEAEEWFMQLTNDAGVSLSNPAFCVAAFVEAARRVKASKPVRRITTRNVMLHGAQKAYEQLREIVRRVDAGETLAQIRAEREARIRESLADETA